jgi:hypothetical protein
LRGGNIAETGRGENRPFKEHLASEKIFPIPFDLARDGAMLPALVTRP